MLITFYEICLQVSKRVLYLHFKQINMKIYTFYKAVSGYWFIEHSLKGTTKLRRWPVTGTIQDAIKRYEDKGYAFINKYGYDKNTIANS